MLLIVGRTVLNDAIAGGTLARYVSQKLQKKSLELVTVTANSDICTFDPVKVR